VADPGAILVTTDKTTVYEGGSATVTLSGADTAWCADWLNGSGMGEDDIGGFDSPMSAGQDVIGQLAGNDGAADNTFIFRCYEGPHEGPRIAPPLANPYASGVTIVFKANGTPPTVTTDRTTVYEGDSASITFEGPDNDECAAFIDGAYSFGYALAEFDQPYLVTLNGKFFADPPVDHTFVFRCYDWAHGSQGTPTPATAYASGVSILVKAAGATPPPSVTAPPTSTTGGTGSNGTALPLLIAALAAALALVSITRVAATRR
jgi:hypothetical protein